MSIDRPKPPRPCGDDDTVPSMRAADPVDAPQRAAGLTRPALKSDPNLRAASNNELLVVAVKKLSEGQAEHANTFRSIAEYMQRREQYDRAQNEALALLARAQGLEEQLPRLVRDSSRPPAKREPAKSAGTLGTIKRDTQFGAGVAVLVLILQIILAILEHGGHP